MFGGLFVLLQITKSIKFTNLLISVILYDLSNIVYD